MCAVIWLLPLIALSGATANCPDPPSWKGSSYTSMFDQHVAEEKAAGLQEACVPRRYEPPPGVPVIGTLMMFHGFSACPQQFWSYAQNLSTLGYNVLLPLNPGHGRAYRPCQNATSHQNTTCDNLNDMPTQSTCGRKRMYDFVGRMNEIMARAPGARVVTGLSLGSTYALAATELNTTLYDRQLIMVPLLGSPIYWKGLVVKGWSYLPWANTKLETWGPGCYHERSLGRGGICTFTISNLGAVLTFAEEILAGIKPVTAHFVSQVMGHEDDPAASPTDMAKGARMLAGNQTGDGNAGTAHFCVNNKNTEHSFISTHDNPNIDKSAYLPELFKQMNDFVIRGTPLPTNGTFPDELHECVVMKGWDWHKHCNPATWPCA